MSQTKLPERYRQASNIETGYEVRERGGDWIEVTWALHIMAPLNFVTLDLADGRKLNVPPRTRLMSRRPGSVSQGESSSG